jgi:hypothetical protein
METNSEDNQPVITEVSIADIEELIVEDKAEEVMQKEVLKTIKPQGKFFQEHSVSIPTEWNDLAETVDMPSSTSLEVDEAIKDSPNVSLVDNETSRQWAEVLKTGQQQANDLNFRSTVNRENTDFRQTISSETGMLGGSSPKLADTEGSVLKGDRAVLRFLSHNKLGTLFNVPLWHTGIWVTLRAPGEGDLLELQRQIIADKIELGRESYGLAFSNTTSYMTDRLTTFVLDHLYDTSLSGDIDLKTVISCQDIPSLLWGLTCAMYPRGFQYQRACIANPATCQHVIKERLNLTKIQWTNKDSLSKSQILHMTKRRANSMTLESVKQYQSGLLDCQPRMITVDTGSETPTNVTLHIPSISDFIDAGTRWIGTIENMVTQSLGLTATDKERNAYIFKHGKATALRQYTHWVQSIEFATNQVEDKETIERILGEVSGIDSARTELMEKLRQYIDDTCFSVIGIPEFVCPACGLPNEVDIKLPNHTSILPIDVYQVFFSLLVQKLQRLSIR